VRHLRRRRALSGITLRVTFAVAALLPLSACGTERDWRILEKRWVEKAGYQPLERYPPREANPSALRIEELLAPLGFQLAPTKTPGRAAVDLERQKRLTQISEEVRDLQWKVDATEGEPSADLSRFLEEIEPALLAVRSEVLDGEPPRWELRLDLGAAAETPQFVGHLVLHRFLLLAGTLAAPTSRVEADAWFDAAATLQSELQRDPILLAQLISLAEISGMQRVLRRLSYVPDHWRSLLPSEPLREGLYESLRLEGWTIHRTAVTGGFDDFVGRMPFAGVFLFQGTRELMDALDGSIERIQREDMRYLNGELLYEDALARIPRWNGVARALLPNLLDAPAKAARTELDLELTTRILKLRERDAAGDVPLPFGREPSRAVPGIIWESERLPGCIRIRAVGGEIVTGSKAPLPLEFLVAVDSLE
jgi:hypothetical protein